MSVNFVKKIDNSVKIKNVLISVSNKRELESFVPALITINPEIMIYSTGGTFSKLKELLGDSWKKNLTSVSEYTGQPEMQGGLVKTLDFKIYLGLLSETYNEAHVKDIERVKGINFDMVVVNLYPFSETIAKPETTPEMARANIDIGGPCMVRASAKNFLRVASVTDPADYSRLIEELKTSAGILSLKTRFELAQKAFTHTAQYDTNISAYLAKVNLKSIEDCFTIENK